MTIASSAFDRPTCAARTVGRSSFSERRCFMLFHTVVIGIDFTDASLRAARWVTSVMAPRSQVVLVHAMPVPPLPSYLRSELPAAQAAMAAHGVSALDACLRGVGESLAPGRVRVALRSGRPAEALASVAEEAGAELVCVARGKRRHGSARFGATTPERLLAATRRAVLVVPGDFAAPSRIIAGVDERQGGEAVLDAACDLASAFGAGIDAVHVVEPELEAYAHASTRFLRAAADEPETTWVHDRACEWMTRASRGARAAGAPPNVVVRRGDPGPELIRHARLGTGGLIVIGRGGESPDASISPRSPGPGSTARLVAWSSTCPVLIVPLRSRTGPELVPRDRRRGRSTVLELHATYAGQERPDTPFPAARCIPGAVA
jgi:nucleotide-binding universal stress UspA family protein